MNDPVERPVDVPKFEVGDSVVTHVPGKAEDGLEGVVLEVREYDGPRCYDDWMYMADWERVQENGDREGFCRAFLPERWLRSDGNNENNPSPWDRLTDEEAEQRCDSVCVHKFCDRSGPGESPCGPGHWCDNPFSGPDD